MQVTVRTQDAEVGAVKGYGQFCPVARACEILGERWTFLVIRELLCGSHRFNQLQRGVPLMSRTLLTQRLRALEDAEVIRSVARARGRGREYYLTPAGEQLRAIVERLGEWGDRWARGSLGADTLDASLLMWDIHRNLRREALPTSRTVVRVDFTGVPRGHHAQRTWWLVLQRPDVDLCLKDPGFAVALQLDADLAAFTRLWLGRASLADLLRAGQVRMDGPHALTQALTSWLGLAGPADVRRPWRRLDPEKAA